MVFSRIHSRFVKISTLLVSMWYISRTDQKLIPIFFIINKKRGRMNWDETGKNSKLKNNFLEVSLILQPIMAVIIFYFNLKIFIRSAECPQNNK
jgi:hypothetical protein